MMSLHGSIRGALFVWLGCATLAVACADNNEGNGGGESSSGDATGTDADSDDADSTGPSDGSDDDGTGSASASGTGGTASDTGGTTGSTGGSTGGTTGGLTCPGMQQGCVDDWAGAFGQNSTSMDGVGPAARFQFIKGITSFGNYLYVAEDETIRRIELDTATVETWVGMANTPNHTEGQGTAARLDDPVGLTTDGTTLWVAERGSNCIRAINLADGQTSTVAGQVGNPGSADGIGSATFEAQRDLIWDGAHLYQIQSNGVLRQIDVATGNVVTVAGLPGTNAFADGVGAAARFDAPRFLTTTGVGDIWVSDTENNRLRRVQVTGGVGDVSTPYGQASAGHADAMGSAAQFDRQRGLSIDGGGDMIVGDSDNFVIRSIDLSSTMVTTIAGQVGVQSHGVGVGTMATIDKPLDLHHDSTTGDLFISEGSVIRRMYR